LNQPDLQKQPSGATNRFPIQPRSEVESASANAADEAVASDEVDPNDSAEPQIDAAAADPFSGRAGGQSVIGLSATSPTNRIERRQESQLQDTTASQDFGNEPGRSISNNTDPGEAEKFVPSGFGSSNFADRIAGNNATANRDDDGDEQVIAGRTGVPSKLTSVKGLDISDRQPNPTNTEADLATDSALPFRKPQATAAPARLDNEALEGNGQATLPMQGETADDRGRRYAVADGDTYWSIAKKAYDSGAYFKALYEHNRRQLNNAGSLRPGMQLLLPDEATLQRLYPSLCPRPQRVAAATRATRASATMPADGPEHVVSEGDTLYDVARRRLGKASRWAEIYELNREEIGAASDRLEPGTRLALPA
jgi:nucleoid-associated protein YgaU